MTFQEAENICKLPVNDGIRALEEMGAVKCEDDVLTLDGYDFFKCFSDSKTLYFEC